MNPCSGSIVSCRRGDCRAKVSGIEMMKFLDWTARDGGGGRTLVFLYLAVYGGGIIGNCIRQVNSGLRETTMSAAGLDATVFGISAPMEVGKVCFRFIDSFFLFRYGYLPDLLVLSQHRSCGGTAT